MEQHEHPAKKIKFLLRQYSLGVRELAERIGIALDALHEILDEKEWPTSNLLYRIASLFNLNENYFAECLKPGSKPPANEPGGSATLTAESLKAHGAAGASQGIREVHQSSPPAAAFARAEKRPPMGVVPQGSPGDPRDPQARKGRGMGRARHARRLDLAEIAARQQSLIDLLVDKKVFTRDEYATRLEILHARIMERKMTEKTR